MIKIPHEHIRENIPIVYTFYGRYNIDRMTEGPSLSYDYVILTLSPGVGDLWPLQVPYLYCKLFDQPSEGTATCRIWPVYG